MNHSNILVSETAMATLVDTDSFQVRDLHGKFYRCPVGTKEFTPREMQGKRFSDIDRGPEQDLFGLGVLIFQLLMEGTHPFAGVFTGHGDDPPLDAQAFPAVIFRMALGACRTNRCPTRRRWRRSFTPGSSGCLFNALRRATGTLADAPTRGLTHRPGRRRERPGTVPFQPAAPPRQPLAGVPLVRAKATVGRSGSPSSAIAPTGRGAGRRLRCLCPSRRPPRRRGGSPRHGPTLPRSAP